MAGLTKPGRSKGRLQTNRWSNRWQQSEGSSHRQIQPGVFWLRVTVVLGRTLRLLVGVASINCQISNRNKFPNRFDRWVSELPYLIHTYLILILGVSYQREDPYCWGTLLFEDPYCCRHFWLVGDDRV